MATFMVPHGPHSRLDHELARIPGEANKLAYVQRVHPHLFPAYLDRFARQHGHTDGKAFMTAAAIAHAHRTPAPAPASKTPATTKPKRRTK
jgi:hypothetical protein